MSIYIMTVGDLAKKRGESVGEFVKRVQSLGFDAGSHAKKLTQADLDFLIPLLEGTSDVQIKKEERGEAPKIQNPNVLLIAREDGRKDVLLVDATLDSSGELIVKVLSKTTESSLGEGLLEFRKQMGIHMGVN